MSAGKKKAAAVKPCDPGFHRWNWSVCAVCGAPRTALADMDGEERVREALTPSGATKAAYSGELEFLVDCDGFDDDGEPMPARKITVPWTTVKEIMAMIAARAGLVIEPETMVPPEEGESDA